MSDYFADVGVWPRAGSAMGKAYAWGFVLSMLLTVASFALTLKHLLSPHALVPVLLLLAFGQFVVQVLNFLHVSGEPDSRERLAALGTAAVIVLILIIGSIWIMNNLDARMAPDLDAMEQYMQKEGGI